MFSYMSSYDYRLRTGDYRHRALMSLRRASVIHRKLALRLVRAELAEGGLGEIACGLPQSVIDALRPGGCSLWARVKLGRRKRGA